MITLTTTLDADAVRAAVTGVPDPELPPVTIGMLGMVHDIAIAGTQVGIELLPTFSGCPATEMIERDVVQAVRAVDGVTDVTVRFRFDPPWTPDRIDEVGRERLREFGITPPGGPVRGAVSPDGHVSLPLAITPGAAGSIPGAAGSIPGAAGSIPGAAGDDTPRLCPYCGSDDTTQDSAFGPTPCRDLRHCASCNQPFEAFKSL